MPSKESMYVYTLAICMKFHNFWIIFSTNSCCSFHQVSSLHGEYLFTFRCKRLSDHVRCSLPQHSVQVVVVRSMWRIFMATANNQQKNPSALLVMWWEKFIKCRYLKRVPLSLFTNLWAIFGLIHSSMLLFAATGQDCRHPKIVPIFSFKSLCKVWWLQNPCHFWCI